MTFIFKFWINSLLSPLYINLNLYRKSVHTFSTRERHLQLTQKIILTRRFGPSFWNIIRRISIIKTIDILHAIGNPRAWYCNFTLRYLKKIILIFWGLGRGSLVVMPIYFYCNGCVAISLEKKLLRYKLLIKVYSFNRNCTPEDDPK